MTSAAEDPELLGHQLLQNEASEEEDKLQEVRLYQAGTAAAANS
jgi:hypothetical protein